jgi:CheY-like chemotaxis protein
VKAYQICSDEPFWEFLGGLFADEESIARWDRVMTKRILIVDDEQRVLFVLRHTVAGLGSGYEVVAMTEAARALDEITENPVDLVITDIFMGGMNGVELTEKVRTLMPDVPVIWITAHGCQRFRQQARDLRIFRCLNKPLEISEIRQVAREAMEVEA